MLRFISIGLLIALTSCGFHLRGTLEFPADFDSLHLSSIAKFDQIYKKIASTLRSNKIKIAPSRANSYSLAIINYKFSEQALFRDAEGKTNSARLHLTINFQLFAKNNKQISQGKVVSSRNINIDANALLQTDNERNIVKQQLIDDAVYKLLRQVTLAITTNS